MKHRCIQFSMPGHAAMHEHDIIEMRKKEFSDIQILTNDMLENADHNYMIAGWRMEFFPCPPGGKMLRPNEPCDAAKYYDSCIANIQGILTFTKERLGMSFQPICHTRLLNFSFLQPEHWDPYTIGTTLQFLANRQREFIVQVSPDLLMSKPDITHVFSTVHPHDPNNYRAKAADHFFTKGNAIEEFDFNVQPPEEEDEDENEGISDM